MNNNKKQIKLYLLLILGVCFLLGAAAFFMRSDNGNAAYQVLQKGFTAFPLIAAVFYFMLFPEQYGGVLDIGSFIGTDDIIQISNKQ